MRPLRIVGYGNSSGSKYWRLEDPFKYLRKKGIQAFVSENGINPEEGLWADIIITQSCTDKKGIALLYQLQQEYGKKIIVECDDGLEVNSDSPFKLEHKIYEAQFVIGRSMQMADMITTTTPYLAKQLKQYNDNVVVLPNFIDTDRWDLPYLPNESKQIRIGWAGSITHVDDVKLIIEPIRRICKEFKNVQLVMVGDPRVGALFKGLPVETMNGVPFEIWPTKLYSLRLDIGLAPLRDTPFNRCKSNIKWIEYSVARIPGVYSPTVYKMSNEHLDGVYGMVAEDAEQWYRCIKNYIICKNLRNDISEKARGCITTGYTLKTNIKRWVKAYKSLTDWEKSGIKV
jgi:glycosyltransferase involved in cell wall biosynthesis